MGGKRTGTGKYVHCCVAILTCLLLSQCAALDRSPLLQSLLPRDESRQHLVQAQQLLAQGDYETALKENQKALSLSADNPPGDEALYNMALVYTCPGNPKRDSVKSVAAFKRLIKEYPQSAWIEQANIWVQVIQEGEHAKRVTATLTQENKMLKQENENAKRVTTTLTQENNMLKQENENAKRVTATVTQKNDKLKGIIAETTKVDLEIEEKKRDSVR